MLYRLEEGRKMKRNGTERGFGVTDAEDVQIPL
jgi:hypothetical protein